MRHLYQDALKGFYYVTLITIVMSVSAYTVIETCKGY